jgi:hypothetical protein
MNRIMRLIVASYAPLVGRMTVVDQVLPPMAPEPTRGRRKKVEPNGVRVMTLTPNPPRLVVPH